MIQLRDVTKQFSGRRNITALHRVSFDVPRGDMLSIVGPSGSGKSTPLNLIGGPRSGDFWRDSHRRTRSRASLRR